MILEICTTYQGIPFGPAFIVYHDPNKLQRSFNGVGIFNEGKLHMSPFVCVDGNGKRSLYSLMINGRPSTGHYAAYFNEDGDS